LRNLLRETGRPVYSQIERDMIAKPGKKENNNNNKPEDGM
jgi:hypothetical protein